MSAWLDNRAGNDRRRHHVSFSRAFERRLYADPRQPGITKNENSEQSWVIYENYWGAYEEAVYAE
jgi:hypothetical protein